ncbi:hypothetical protein NDU88_004219 [Pleurodeles waltl]|uniref:Uncharacterized protein n=1 Tax=Pleurodeles waltl TaxID=8319 RepID=A0AAV7QH59_PLEWA|nr:hypothetical protein NDU88_004219 [Pleurodeles waltl]
MEPAANCGASKALEESLELLAQCSLQAGRKPITYTRENTGSHAFCESNSFYSELKQPYLEPEPPDIKGRDEEKFHCQILFEQLEVLWCGGVSRGTGKRKRQDPLRPVGSLVVWWTQPRNWENKKAR